MKNLITIVILILSVSPGDAAVIRVAVASNFANALKDISSRYEQNTGHQVKISSGSTGKHYAQIKNGAPFDIFFAADTRRPQLLDNEGIAVAQSRFTYAQGRLVLWSPDKQLIDADASVLDSMDFKYLAVANPKLAPYGKAAKQVLQNRGLWQILTKKMVRGENIGQTFQFVKSGNAQLGFVAASQVERDGKIKQGSYWLVPEEYYSAINQQVVLLKDNQLAKDFLDYIRSDEVLTIINNFGYKIP